ncbi:MAG: hypothetical protein HOV80_29200 [Polyangiaceae bacterium]|nr:hypothetical protein [Polyangiaceae bacterium]
MLPWILMPSSACLVTSSPTFDEREQTKPFLDFESAIPDPREIHIISSTVDRETFSAQVRSEDVFEKVKVRAFVDYGKCNLAGQPFDTPHFGNDLDASTFEDTGRVAETTVILDGLPIGCHRITLIATHEFDDFTGCPVDPDDFTQITWNVLICNSDDPEAQDCVFDPLTCPAVEASCTNRTACEP